jgi:hypothetical protein
LKSIAIMLMAVEPLQIITERIPLVVDGGSIVLEDGTTVMKAFAKAYYPSGVILAVGIVAYCVALIFKHGIYLQKQSDETL